MSRSQRLLDLIQVLRRHRRPVSGAVLADAVGVTHADWSKRGLTIAQPPTQMDFGHTFVALDPDGHRLRVFAPAAA
jgi:predicted enzyme related to lactoylglutathione lyase